MKKYYKVFLPLLLLSIACNSNSNRHLIVGEFTVKIIDVDNGKFGYDIYKDTTLLIHQPVIPAASGNSGFMTEKEAAVVARLVVGKLSNSKSSQPSVTTSELDSLKIAYR